jgi:hypothetical protein
LYWQFCQQWTDESWCVAAACCLHTVVLGIVCESRDIAVKYRLFHTSSCRSTYYSPFNPVCTPFDTVAYRGGVWGFKPPPQNSEILTKYQKLRKFYYMKWNFLYQITAASRTPD